MIVNREEPSIGFAAVPLDARESCWTWTLTTRLGDLLAKAEGIYGPRDLEYTPLGIEFGGDRPGLWYPGSCKFISIRLSDSARTDPNRAFFQLAHEVVHLLSPSGGSHAPVLEEGLATAFSHDQSALNGVDFHSASAEYLEAEALTRQLLTIRPDAVLQLRKCQPAFTRMTPDLMKTVVPGCTEELALALCQPFRGG